MTESASSSRQFPDHIDEAVRSIAQLHSEHHDKTTAAQRLINRISAVIARPHFVAFLTIGVAVWIGANLAAIGLGRYAVRSALIPLAAGRRELALAVHRDACSCRPEARRRTQRPPRDPDAGARNPERTQNRQSHRASGGTAPG